MGKYLDIARQAEKPLNSADSGESDSDSLEKPQREGAYEINELNELSPICIFCRQPVERGKPGSGALAGDDLHMDCFEEDARAAAEERAAIQTEANTRPTQHEKNQDDPLREFDEWIRSEPCKPDTNGK